MLFITLLDWKRLWPCKLLMYICTDVAQAYLQLTYCFFIIKQYKQIKPDI
ncbi:hypothetical protein EIKCOROL_00503 [Eikenella corrodens ATCC 23834]|uniref:Uncharacterized protein n=1 Tax=Eikenella corrodens ATCC 23834 TaxID=546274 RepID=C0DT29_EIKCO|nr:hypothetical protein EIKCOROL_00503 [Eikenella corrodens ATCC 23834]